MKRIMGVDYGDARTGIAVSDLLCSIVGTTSVIHSRNAEKTITQICAMVKTLDVGEIVVGLPKNMDGTLGFRAEATYEFADFLKTLTDTEIVYWDERLTTVSATFFLNQTNTRGKDRKKVIDTVSASIILENYMQSIK